MRWKYFQIYSAPSVIPEKDNNFLILNRNENKYQFVNIKGLSSTILHSEQNLTFAVFGTILKMSETKALRRMRFPIRF